MHRSERRNEEGIDGVFRNFFGLDVIAFHTIHRRAAQSGWSCLQRQLRRVSVPPLPPCSPVGLELLTSVHLDRLEHATSRVLNALTDTDHTFGSAGGPFSTNEWLLATRTTRTAVADAAAGTSSSGCRRGCNLCLLRVLSMYLRLAATA